MRTLILTLAVVLLAVPAMADVKIIVEVLDETTAQISYDATGETELPRAFALDLTATDGNVVDVNDFAVGDNNGGYGIFPGNFSRFITVNATTGAVDSWADPGYTPVADAGDPGAAGALGSSAITIEMGALYDDAPPADTGVLCTVTVTEGTSNLCATGNALRGNVVLEDAAEATLDLVEACSGPFLTECFPSSFTTYTDWIAYGKPKCWCSSSIDPEATGDYQCLGDADGKTEGFQKYRVFTKDLIPLVDQWKKKIADVTDPCADFDHKAEGFQKYRVFTKDLIILVDNWKKKDVDLTGNCGTLANPE